jgi:hypothetical protein
MTLSLSLSLSTLTTRLVNFERQINHFQAEAKSLKKVPCSEEQFNKIKSEYNALNTERKSLKKAVINIEKSAEKSFQNSILQTFISLNENYKRLDGKFDRNYATATTGRELDKLFNQYMELSVKESEGPKQIDKIKERNFELVVRPAITAAQLKKSIELDNSIEKAQKDLARGQLRELYQLAKWHPGTLEAKKQNSEKMNDIFYNQLPSCMLGIQVQKQICEKVKSKQSKYFVTKKLDLASPIAYSFLTWSKVPVFKNIDLLSKTIFDHPLFPRNEPIIDNKEEHSPANSSDSSDSEEEIKEIG